MTADFVLILRDRPLVNRPGISTGAQCRIRIIASHPEHPFPVPENLAAKGVRERKRSVPRLSMVRNLAKRLKVVRRPETVYRLLTPRRD